MSDTVARLKKGDLLLKGDIKDRLPVIRNGLVAYFPFDGVIDHVINFDGTDDYIDLGSFEELIDIKSGGQGTLEYWFYHYGSTSSSMLFHHFDFGERFFMHANNGTENRFVVSIADGANSIDTSVPKEEWHHIAITWNNGSANLYIDGILDNTITYTPPVSYSHDDFEFGRAYHTSDRYANAQLYDVRLWNIERTATDIQNHMMQAPNAGETGLIRHWRMNEGSGDILHDSISNSTYRPVYGNPIWIEKSIDTNTDTTLTYDGLAVEEATTNLIPPNETTFENWNSYQNAIVTLTQNQVVPEWRTTKGTRITINGGDHIYKYLTQIIIPSVDGQDYTVSLMIKNIGKHAVRIRTQVGNAVTIEPNEIKKMISKGIGNGTSNLQLRFEALSASDNLDFIAYQPMAEERSFPTSFVDGSRDGNGELILSANEINISEGSFVIKINPTDNIHSDTNYIDIVDTLENGASNRFLMLRKDANSNKINRIYLRNGTSWSSYDIDSYINLNEENIFIWTWKDGGQFTLHVNNSWSTEGDYTLSDKNLDEIICKKNSIIKDVSIYNRQLTPSEVNKSINSKLSIDHQGNIYNSIQERPHIPSESIYFPLNTNGKDQQYTIQPLENTLDYHHDTAWIGEGTTNLTPGADGTISSGAAVGTTPPTIELIDEVHPFGTKAWKVTFHAGSDTGYTGSRFSSHDMWNVVKDGRPYTTSVYIKGDTSKITLYHTGAAGWATMAPQSERIGDYIHYAGTSSSDVGVSGDNSFRPFLDTSTNEDITIYIIASQVEEKAFSSPFIDGTRAFTKLTYTSTDVIPDITDFSMIMWIKYQDQSGLQLSGDWSTFYFGIDGDSVVKFSWYENSVNTGDTNSQRGISASVGPIPKDQWVMIGVSVKENQFIDMYYNGEQQDHYTESFYLTTTQSIFALNSFSEVNESYPLNAYVKNLIFTKALTADEIQAIYQQEMKAYDSHIQIQGNTQTNIDL